jgi:hypothetical protein
MKGRRHPKNAFPRRRYRPILDVPIRANYDKTGGRKRHLS